MTNTPAQQKRNDAIQAVVNAWYQDNAERQVIVFKIHGLFPLGRTDRWEAAVCRWLDMVGNTETPLDWAVLQGAIFATHAA